MEAIECIKTRRSIRKFSDVPVSRNIVEKIVEAAAMSPSWANTQTVRYLVTDERATIDRIALECYTDGHSNINMTLQSPLLIAVVSVAGIAGRYPDGSFKTTKEDRWENFDAGIAVQTFCLAAHALGVGTVIIGNFDEKKAGEIFAAEEGTYVSALIAAGFPAERPAERPRKPLSELLAYRP